MRTCFVPLCDAKNKDQPNRTMFLVPREKSLFEQWVAQLPKVRTLRSNDRICYLHFIPEDVVNTFDHIINGEVYKLKRDRPRLKHDAVPCLEFPTTEELASYKAKTRPTSICKGPMEKEEQIIQQENLELIPLESETRNPLICDNNEETEQQQFKPSLSDEIEEFDIENVIGEIQESTIDFENQVTLLREENINESDDKTPGSSSIGHEQSILDLFNLIYDNINEILIPNSLWGIHRCPNRSIIFFTYMNMVEMQVTKMITIDKEGFIRLYGYTRLINTLHLVVDIDDIDALSILLNQVDLWRKCSGRYSSPYCEIVVKPNDDNCWCTDENEQVFLCKLCLQQH